MQVGDKRMAIIGIDLGTTNSLVTAFKNNEIIFIPNRHGEFLTPSVVAVDKKKELVVGKTAKERLVTHPEATTSLFKRNMGENTTVSLGKKRFAPEELSSFVLRQLIEDAKAYLDESIEEVVISVPAYFNAKQRAATKRAGQLAGVKVERLVNEPSAAALACRQEGKDDVFIVFDFGGGTLDVSIVEIFGSVINICAISGNNQLGGQDFDDIIARAMCQENDKNFNDLSAGERQTLLALAEKAKMKLQEEEEVHLSANIQNQKIEMLLTNDKLKDLSKDLFAQLKKPIQWAVNDSDLEIDEINKCVLVGGSCHMKIVQEFLSDLLRIPVVNSEDIDQIVAKGLGLYVGIKERQSEVKDLVLTDICPFTLSVGKHNVVDPNKLISHSIIARNSTLPTSRSYPFQTIELGQTALRVGVYQGEAIYADDNILLGELDLTVPYNKKDHEQIVVTFYYDINAILVVKMDIISTGEEHSLALTGDGLGVSGQEMQKYLKNIESMKLKAVQHERQAYLLEQAQRIYKESPDEQRNFIERLILELEKLTGAGSIKKREEKLDVIEQHLKQIDGLNYSKDIFNKNPSTEQIIQLKDHPLFMD